MSKINGVDPNIGGKPPTRNIGGGGKGGGGFNRFLMLAIVALTITVCVVSKARGFW